MAKDARHALERCLRAVLWQGIKAAEDEGRPVSERVHHVRTAIKKAKALLRLADPLLGKAGRRERKKLTAVARGIGAVRDARVVVETFDLMMRGRRRSRSSAALRSRLAARRRKGEQRRAAKELRRAARALRAARRRAKGVLHRGDGRRALAAGLTNGYRRAQTTLRAARRRRTPEALHEWRKTVKAHAFHVDLFVRAGAANLRRRAGLLETLAEILGAAHDLTLLEESVRAEVQQATPPRARDALLARVHTRRRDLDDQALALGRRLFRQPSRQARLADSAALARLDQGAEL